MDTRRSFFRTLTGLAALAFLLSGCAGPLQPTGLTDIAPDVQPAWTLLRSVPVATWSAGESVADWLDGLPIRAIRVTTLRDDYDAYYDGKDILVAQAALTRLTTVDLAAVLAHEARHADGYGHTCGETRDRAEADGGALAVHVWVLELLGDPDAAARVRAQAFCR